LSTLIFSLPDVTFPLRSYTKDIEPVSIAVRLIGLVPYVFRACPQIALVSVPILALDLGFIFVLLFVSEPFFIHKCYYLNYSRLIDSIALTCTKNGKTVLASRPLLLQSQLLEAIKLMI
jgi:hypothetical protein